MDESKSLAVSLGLHWRKCSRGLGGAAMSRALAAELRASC